MSKFLILIPARFGSSRFPGKPLHKINGKSMISYVVENCILSGFDYAVVTDNDDIENEVLNLKGNVVRVDDNVTTGSERIALAYKKFFKDKNYEYIINVQGDEPLLSGDVINKIGRFHTTKDYDIATAVKKRSSFDEDFLNTNIVKCILSPNKRCLYFSRQSIPFARDNNEYSWYQHVGIYSYKPSALLDFVKLEESSLEKLERLEQLRALENNITICAEIIDIDLIGVDCPDDIKKVEKVLNE